MKGTGDAAPTGMRERQRSRVLTAFVLTPVSMAVVAALVMAVIATFSSGSRVLGETLGETLSQALVVMLWSPLVAYPVAFLVGVPLYLLVRRRWRITCGSCVVGGAAASTIGSVGVIAIEGGDLVTATAAGIFAAMAAIGAAYGAVFWFLAFWHRAPPAWHTASADDR